MYSLKECTLEEQIKFNIVSQLLSKIQAPTPTLAEVEVVVTIAKHLVSYVLDKEEEK